MDLTYWSAEASTFALPQVEESAWRLEHLRSFLEKTREAVETCLQCDLSGNPPGNHSASLPCYDIRCMGLLFSGGLRIFCNAVNTLNWIYSFVLGVCAKIKDCSSKSVCLYEWQNRRGRGRAVEVEMEFQLGIRHMQKWKRNRWSEVVEYTL